MISPQPHRLKQGRIEPSRLQQAVLQQASARLDKSSHLFLRHVICRLESGDLCIEGKVPSFYLKQTAQSLMQSIDGVQRIVNRLEVVSSQGVSSEHPVS